MRAEAVVFQSAAPVAVADCRPVFLWTYAVHPVIVIRETASRPAQYRDLESLQRLKYIAAVAVLIGNGRVLSDPDPSVNANCP